MRESVYSRTIDRKLALNLIVIFNSFTDISFLKYVVKIFCVSYYFQEKIQECLKEQLSVAAFVYILSSKEANQLQELQTRPQGNNERNFLLKLRSSNVFPTIFFWKFAEVLGQHLKSQLRKIMSQHIIQLIRITPRFCKLSSLVFLCALHKSKS